MAPQPEQPPRSTRLRALIDDLILFGRILLETLRHEPESEAAERIFKRFRTTTVAAIIARITRGLMLAAALADRVEQSVKQIDNPRSRPLETRKPGSSPRPARKPLIDDDDAALLARMPTAEEIAANIRTRPISEVLADIAVDLGLNCDDPLYRQIHAEIVRSHCATALFRLVRPLVKAYAGFTPRKPASSPAVAPSVEPAPQSFGTGPPFPLAA